MRLALLGLLGAVVVIGAVYLLLEVKSTPASASVVASGTAASHGPQVAPHEDTVRAPDHTAPAAPSVVAPAIEDTDGAIAELDKANPKLDAIMDQANKHYDRMEYDDAKAIAGKVLAKAPTNARMMRIMISSSCIDGDVAVAQKWYEQLPKGRDRDEMKTRCEKYSVTLKDPAQ
ncbi:MAG TPA: hypothetical protein VGC41_26755 [Kofleriaceae bacterium]